MPPLRGRPEQATEPERASMWQNVGAAFLVPRSGMEDHPTVAQARNGTIVTDRRWHFSFF